MKDKKFYTVKEVAEEYNVTTMGVRYWLSKGLKHQKERVLGIKERIVIDLNEVEKFLGLTRRK